MRDFPYYYVMAGFLTPYFVVFVPFMVTVLWVQTLRSTRSSFGTFRRWRREMLYASILFLVVEIKM